MFLLLLQERRCIPIIAKTNRTEFFVHAAANAYRGWRIQQPGSATTFARPK